ncbi:Glycosyl transferase family 8 protein [Trichomonas vaginalis G3]|uniref:Glycosyl transferase family 8 protein n=1 Tax=Trichomonas vaginalis (strain ATCC PRA-98 / G3) TaxID=412133 RepID=A2FI17_TRIV3|nr:glycosyl transferase [Trichomonas vaginalis G3]EAX95445.1 Glycosyl transferase family 8 protein [Trichomonas vaginalis G3]KAI5542878.1 glycogenin subfamily member family [Trichomonas vaginalis G3]|eukprot:XP_001308375.1 glycosyl transferase [Trichomonas vaginalis G3]
MLCFFLICLALSDVEDEEDEDVQKPSGSMAGNKLSDSDEEEEQIDDETYFTDYNIEKAKREKDMPPRSRYAYVSVYSSDIQEHFGYLQMLTVLGYSLKTLSPNYDRVLIVSQPLSEAEQLMNVVKKVWTHIIVRPHIKWPNEYHPGKSENAFWFKFQIYTLTQYEKICFFGADTLVFRDVSFVFDYEAPSSGYDIQTYGLLESGFRFNHDFLLIKPSLDDYSRLLEVCLDYVGHPEKDANSIGTYDTAVLTKFYAGNIHLLPILCMHENRGYKRTILQDPSHPTSKILSSAAHFGGDSKPWKKRMTIYSEVWMIFASNVYEKLDVPFSAGQLGQAEEEIVNILFGQAAEANRLKKIQEGLKYDDDDDGLVELYPNPAHSGTRRNVTMLFLVLFISMLLLKITIGTANPFNVFMQKIEKGLDQFVRLDEEQPRFAIQTSQVETRKKGKKSKRRKGKGKKSKNTTENQVVQDEQNNDIKPNTDLPAEENTHENNDVEQPQ